MDSADRDRVEGAFDKTEGKVKSTWGEATGDEQTEAEGKGDETKGDLKDGMADVKDKVTGFVDDIKDRDRN